MLLGGYIHAFRVFQQESLSHCACTHFLSQVVYSSFNPLLKVSSGEHCQFRTVFLALAAVFTFSRALCWMASQYLSQSLSRMDFHLLYFSLHSGRGWCTLMKTPFPVQELTQPFAALHIPFRVLFWQQVACTLFHTFHSETSRCCSNFLRPARLLRLQPSGLRHRQWMCQVVSAASEAKGSDDSVIIQSQPSQHLVTVHVADQNITTLFQLRLCHPEIGCRDLHRMKKIEAPLLLTALKNNFQIQEICLHLLGTGTL